MEDLYCTVILYNISTNAEDRVATRATYSSARANFAKIWDEVENSREPAILERRGHDAMALLPADELSSLQETAHLLRSPKNAQRLFTSLQSSLNEEGAPQSPSELRAELGID